MSDSHRQIERLKQACAGALDALRTEVRQVTSTVVGQQDATDALFVPLGQAVIWIAALDDFFRNADRPNYQRARNADPQGEALMGHRLVRNAILHGEDVVKLLQADAGAVLGRMILGRSKLGSASSCTWVALGELRLTQSPKDDYAESYQRHFANRPIMAPLSDCFAFLQKVA